MERHVSHVIDAPALHRENLIIRLYTQGTFIVQVVVDEHEDSVELLLATIQQDNIIGKAVIVPDARFFFHDMIQPGQIEVGKELGEEKMSIARNNLEIEKALKITKGKPMDVDKADKQNANPKFTEKFIPDPKGAYMDRRTKERFSLNPNYNEQYSVNCQTCAPAYALRLRGFGVTAKGKTPGSKLEYLSNGHAFEV